MFVKTMFSRPCFQGHVMFVKTISSLSGPCLMFVKNMSFFSRPCHVCHVTKLLGNTVYLIISDIHFFIIVQKKNDMAVNTCSQKLTQNKIGNKTNVISILKSNFKSMIKYICFWRCQSFIHDLLLYDLWGTC